MRAVNEFGNTLKLIDGPPFCKSSKSALVLCLNESIASSDTL